MALPRTRIIVKEHNVLVSAVPESEAYIMVYKVIVDSSHLWHFYQHHNNLHLQQLPLTTTSTQNNLTLSTPGEYAIPSTY